jgi:hypothetical protein
VRRALFFVESGANLATAGKVRMWRFIVKADFWIWIGFVLELGRRSRRTAMAATIFF